MSISIALDTTKCQAYGLCMGISPDVFDAPSGSPIAVLLRDSADEDEREDLEEAARSCPAQAITLTSTGA
jgi:ferredoxin